MSDLSSHWMYSRPVAGTASWLPVGRHPEYSAFLIYVIPFLDTAEQSNTTVCLTASSMKANVNIRKVSEPIFANLKQQLDAHAIFFKVYHFLKKQKLHWTQHTVTLHSNACHTGDEFCTNCSSCGGQGVTGDNLTLQRKDLSADQYGRLPTVVKCPLEQIQ